MSTNNGRKIILDLCGGTGAWSRPYQESGEYDVRIIDTQEWSDKTGTGDVRLYEVWDPSKQKVHEKVHGILCAPPCTHLCASGSRWWEGKGEVALIEALSVADACLRLCTVLNPIFWAIENPIGRLTRYWGLPVMYFDPCDYGEPYRKRTALWGNFQPPERTPVKATGKSPVHYCPQRKSRALERSVTPPGFARAFFAANR